MARLQWSEPASAALIAIVREHRQRVGFIAARSLRERIMRRVGLLRDFPELGQRIAMTPWDDRRMLLESPYRIIYRIQDDIVHIVSIVHARALLPGPDGDEEPLSS